MAHQISLNKKTGLYEFCFSHEDGPAWHSLGQSLTADASIDDWKREAGMEWNIMESAVMYQTMTGQQVYSDKKVLFRSDTHEPLSVVGSDYHVVQPTEVLEFFRDLTEIHGFRLSAAGTLFGGKRFWATANIGKSFQVSHGDEIGGQLLLVSSADSSIATSYKICSTRTVCSNTLAVAMAENAKLSGRKTHRTEFDAKAVKLDLGLIDAGWESFKTNITKLVDVKVSDTDAEVYFKNKLYNPNVMAEDQTWKVQKDVQELMYLFRSGTGSDMSYGTAWGVVNSVTEKFTHNNGKRDQSAKFWDSEFGTGAKFKQEVFSDMLALAA